MLKNRKNRVISLLFFTSVQQRVSFLKYENKVAIDNGVFMLFRSTFKSFVIFHKYDANFRL